MSADASPSMISAYISAEDLESMQEYRAGGLHPVRIGDVLLDGRFELLRKLGHGSFSTVWLARDHENLTVVAIKILSSAVAHVNEVEGYTQLRSKGLDKMTENHIVDLVGSFKHHGPNGEHWCLIFELMGSSISELLDRWNPAAHDISLETIKIIIKQALLSIDCLHAAGLAHGDIHAGNFLLTTRAISFDEVLDFKQKSSDTAVASSPNDDDDDASELSDGSRPEYLCFDKPLAKLVDHSSLQVKLADFGCAFPLDDPPLDCITPTALRAPELILRLSLDGSIDIWNLGCLIFEWLTNDPLIHIMDYWGKTPGKENRTTDDHMLELIDVLYYNAHKERVRNDVGDSETPRCDVSFYHRYYNAHKERVRNDVGDSETPRCDVSFGPTLEQKLKTGQPSEMNDAEAIEVLSILRKMLAYDPRDRPTTRELLSMK